MNLKVFHKENCHGSRAGLPAIRITRSGMFGINKKACALMNIKDKSKIFILQDQECLEDWYIQKTDDTKGFVVRISGGKWKTAAFNAASLAREILASTGNGEEISSRSFPISKKTTEIGNGNLAHAIITKATT